MNVLSKHSPVTPAKYPWVMDILSEHKKKSVTSQKWMSGTHSMDWTVEQAWNKSWGFFGCKIIFFDSETFFCLGVKPFGFGGNGGKLFKKLVAF